MFPARIAYECFRRPRVGRRHSFGRCGPQTLGTGSGSGEVFEDDGDALADADAHRRQAVAPAGAAQVMSQRGDDAHAAATERVTDGDRSALLVDDRRIELRPLAQAGQRLRGERLVQLDRGEVAPTDPGSPQRRARCLDRADAVQVRIDAAGCRG